MRLLVEKTIRKIFSGYLYPYSRVSYSQNGEDIIIRDLFARIGIKQPSYLDIGSNEPFYISNTYLLYTKGSKGVCVEPNPSLHKKFKKKRPRDICLNAGIAFNNETSADFYMFSGKASGLSTFSKEEAEFWEKTGNTVVGKHKIESVVKVRLLQINEIISQYFSPHPNFISLDVEGLDLAILETIDFGKHKPEIFCIETLGYAENDKETKNKPLIDFMISKGYFLYADTYINGIFCREDVYKARS